jgi:hypothetical protein
MQFQRAVHAKGEDPFDIGGAAGPGDKGRVVGGFMEVLEELLLGGEGVLDDARTVNQADMVFTEHGGETQFLARTTHHQGAGLGDGQVGDGEADIDAAQVVAHPGSDTGKTSLSTAGKQPGVLLFRETRGGDDFCLLQGAEALGRLGECFVATGNLDPATTLSAAEIEAIGKSFGKGGNPGDRGGYCLGLFAKAATEQMLPIFVSCHEFHAPGASLRLLGA